MTDDLYERYKEALRVGHVAVLRGALDAALIYGNRLREKELITNRAGSCAQIGMNVVSRK